MANYSISNDTIIIKILEITYKLPLFPLNYLTFIDFFLDFGLDWPLNCEASIIKAFRFVV